MAIIDEISAVPRNVWIVIVVSILIIAWGSYYWGKSNGLEESK